MKIREAQSSRSKDINVRCLVDPTAVATQIAVSQIIRHDENDVRSFGRNRGYNPYQQK